MGAYLRLLRYRPAAAPFLAATVARLPISMAPLGILLLVQSERDAYSLAGIVTGAFAIGSAIGTPLWAGRWTVRAGPGAVADGPGQHELPDHVGAGDGRRAPTRR